MQLTDRVKNCNGCAACVVGCKYVCVRMEERPEGQGKKKQPVINENGCNRCNACALFCPLFNPVELPEFEQYMSTVKSMMTEICLPSIERP